MKITTLNFALLASLAFAMTACSTAPVTPKSELSEALLNGRVVVAPIAKPAQLSERTKAQAIGNFAVATVVSSAIGSGAGAANMQQMQANMEVMQSFSKDLQQALPNSYVVSAGKGADLALAKKISEYLVGKKQSATPSNRELSLLVNAPLWELGYVSFLTSQDYALNYNLQVSVLEQKEGKLRMLMAISCTNSAKDKMTLDKWKADNYKAVDESATTIVQECFNQFLADTGLN